MKTKQLKYSLLLVMAALIWGMAFVAQTEGGDTIGPFAFNGIRNLMGALVLQPVILVIDKLRLSPRKPVTKADRKQLIKGSVWCGTALCFASCSQQMALTLGASAGKAGFMTAVYILLVPIIGIFLNKKCGLNIWIAVLVALAGLYFLCINGTFSLSLPDTLLLLCALLFSWQILSVDHFSPTTDSLRLAAGQFLVCGILSMIPAAFFDIAKFDSFGAWAAGFGLWEVWRPLLFAGVMSTGVAYTLQMVAQPKLNPTVASLLMSLESVFASLSGLILLHQILTTRELIGCVLMFAAIILAQLPERGGKQATSESAANSETEEIFDIVDENGKPTGETVSRSSAHDEGIRHRTAHIWVVRKTETGWDVLLQKRSQDKDSFPGCYDTSSAGHIQAGDEPLESALRELSEELGIKAEPTDLSFAGTFNIAYEKEFRGKMFKDNEVSYVYVYDKPVDAANLTLQKEEVEAVEWFDMDYVLAACNPRDPRFCVPTGGIETLRNYLQKQ